MNVCKSEITLLSIPQEFFLGTRHVPSKSKEICKLAWINLPSNLTSLWDIFMVYAYLLFIAYIDSIWKYLGKLTRRITVACRAIVVW